MNDIRLAVADVAQLRELISGTYTVSQQLRRSLDAHFPAPEEEPGRPGSLINRLGPVLRHPIERPQTPRRPLPSDVAAIVEGRVLPKHRHRYAWDAIWAWIEDESYEFATLATTKASLKDSDEALRRHQLPALSAILAPRLLGVRLPNLPRSRSGWASYTESQRITNTLERACDDDALLAEIIHTLSDLPLGRGRALLSRTPVS